MLKIVTVPLTLSGVESVVRLDQAHEQVTQDCVSVTMTIAAALDEDTSKRKQICMRFVCLK